MSKPARSKAKKPPKPPTESREHRRAKGIVTGSGGALAAKLREDFREMIGRLLDDGHSPMQVEAAALKECHSHKNDNKEIDEKEIDEKEAAALVKQVIASRKNSPRKNAPRVTKPPKLHPPDIDNPPRDKILRNLGLPPDCPLPAAVVVVWKSDTWPAELTAKAITDWEEKSRKEANWQVALENVELGRKMLRDLEHDRALLNGAAEDRPERIKIPPSRQTKPMSYREAARHLGKGDSRDAAEWFSKSVADGTFRCEHVTRQIHIFDRNDFPKESWAKITPK